MHVSNGALASFTDTLPLLHPFGRLVCHDLFLTEAGQYQPASRPGQVRRLGGQLGQRPAARPRATGAASTSGRAAARRPAGHVTMLTAQVRD